MARNLLTVGLYAASHADEPNLRAHVLADLAAQHNYLGYPDDALRVVRLGEVDERVDPAVQMVVNGVKARAYAVRGEVEACLRHIELAEQAQAAASSAEGWLATVATPPHLYATTGHAAATLGRRTGLDAPLADAKQRLTQAVDEFDRDAQARAAALCMAQLATLHLEEGELHEGGYWGRMAVAGAGIRSHRPAEHLVTLRTACGAHTNDAAIRELVADINTMLTSATSRSCSVVATGGRNDSSTLPRRSGGANRSHWGRRCTGRTGTGTPSCTRNSAGRQYQSWPTLVRMR